MNSEIMYGVSIFIGILVGTIVNAATHYLVKWRNSKQDIKHLKFELQMNIKKMDKFLEEIIEYRNSVNSETMDLYCGYYK